MAKLYPKFRTIALKKVNGAHSSIARSAVIYVKPRQQNRDANQGAAGLNESRRVAFFLILHEPRRERRFLLPPRGPEPAAGNYGAE
jgi:hypothetical protein